MALYLGSSGKRELILDGHTYCLNLLSSAPILNGIILLSSDAFVLKDSKGTYLTAKESE